MERVTGRVLAENVFTVGETKSRKHQYNEEKKERLHLKSGLRVRSDD
jgi:uncharacterized protein YueI